MTKVMTSRQRILDFLRAHPGATAGEIARTLRQTPANARHHLGGLVRDGLVASSARPSQGRGRPEKAYSLSLPMQGDNLSALSAALLEAHLGDLSADEREPALEDLAERLSASPPGVPGMTLPRRLSALVEVLSTLHYQARWEARATGPHIILGHCPFAAIIGRHPELCRMDAHLLKRGLGAPVAQEAKLEPNERGVPVCIFSMP